MDTALAQTFAVPHGGPWATCPFESRKYRGTGTPLHRFGKKTLVTMSTNTSVQKGAARLVHRVIGSIILRIFELVP